MAINIKNVLQGVKGVVGDVVSFLLKVKKIPAPTITFNVKKDGRKKIR